MTKRVRSDRRPYDIRPVSLIRPGQAKSQDALDNLSRYEEVSRQFAQEFPQLARSLEQHHWIPCFLSPNTGRQENSTTALADDATAADSSACPIRGMVDDSEFATSAGYDISMHSDEDYCVGALPLAMITATSSPFERLGNADSFTPPDSEVDSDPSYDPETLTSQLLWHNQVKESRYNCAQQGKNGRKMEKQSLVTPPVEQRDSNDFDNKALAEASCVDRDKMNQIIMDLNQLGTRLHQDARRQLDVINGDACL
ncbi:hypothetical protein TrVGV298_008513 [Trichoderma virens]|nr:hypothetical protein TrVGV298_008513 [Trichoderma virens]